MKKEYQGSVFTCRYWYTKCNCLKQVFKLYLVNISISNELLIEYRVASRVMVECRRNAIVIELV